MDKTYEYALRVFKTDKEYDMYFLHDMGLAIRISDNLCKMHPEYEGYTINIRRETDKRG